MRGWLRPWNRDDIERFEEERELELYREYRDVLPMFTYVIETERRFYLANTVDIVHLDGGWVRVDLARRMGLGHVPSGSVRRERQGDDAPRRERRRARASRGTDHAPGSLSSPYLALLVSAPHPKVS